LEGEGNSIALARRSRRESLRGMQAASGSSRSKVWPWLMVSKWGSLSCNFKELNRVISLKGLGT
jgi:hypothetical protein